MSNGDETPQTSIEEWAKQKGMADRFLRQTGIFIEPNPAFTDFAAAKALAAWADGQVVTEAEFDGAVMAAKNQSFR